MEPWPSTITQSPSRSPCSTMRSTVPWRKSDTTASTGAPQPSIMMPVWPVATNEVLTPASRAARRSSSMCRHLAHGAVRTDRQDDPACPGHGGGRPRSSGAGRAADILERDTVHRRGRDQVGVVREERMQPRDDVQAVPDGRQQDDLPGLRQAAAGGCDADEQRVRAPGAPVRPRARRPRAHGTDPGRPGYRPPRPGRLVESMTATTLAAAIRSTPNAGLGGVDRRRRPQPGSRSRWVAGVPGPSPSGIH